MMNKEHLNVHDPYNKYPWAKEKNHKRVLLKVLIGGTLAFLLTSAVIIGVIR